MRTNKSCQNYLDHKFRVSFVKHVMNPDMHRCAIIFGGNSIRTGTFGFIVFRVDLFTTTVDCAKIFIKFTCVLSVVMSHRIELRVIIFI